MGPGIMRAGWEAWEEAILGASCFFDGGSGSEFFNASGLLRGMRLPCVSSRCPLRSVENGVFSSRNGLESRCLEKRLRREFADAREVMLDMVG